MLNKDDFLNSVSNRINSALCIALESDPANKRFLEKLNGARIRVSCTSPTLHLLVKVEHSEIALNKISFSDLSVESEPANLTISGTAINLTKLLTTPMDNAASLSDVNVSVIGDVGLLLQLSQVAKTIEIDWELLLAERIGETPTVLFSRAIRIGFSEAKKLQLSLSENFREKMQSEESPIPNKGNLDKAKNELRDLGYRLDRLEAKLALHRQKT